jgi:hypothetical protein
MCADDSEAGQVRALLAFLAPVVGLGTDDDGPKVYKEAWARLNPAADKEEWESSMAVNFPWSAGKVELWRTLRRDVEGKFQAALNEHLNGEFTHRPVVEFSFMDYSEMLLELLDTFLQGLDKYIAIQDEIQKVTGDPDAYPEDMRDLLEKGMWKSGLSRAEDFLDVILFLHAVPQRSVDRWDALDHEWDVSWFRGHCGVYQKSAELMAFLRDCAVVVLLTGHFRAEPGVLAMHACYVELQ